MEDRSEMNMTKNPLALVGGIIIMLFGISLGIFFGYNFFFEEKMYRKANKSVMGILVRKEKQEIYPDALSTKDEEKQKAAAATQNTTRTQNTTKAPTKSTTETAQTTAPEMKPLIKYNLHYAFTPAKATTPVTAVLNDTTERLFNAMTVNDKIEILYNEKNPKEDHRALFPYDFGRSFYLGVGALLGGALFITYLGWCFIFPED